MALLFPLLPPTTPRTTLVKKFYATQRARFNTKLKVDLSLAVRTIHIHSRFRFRSEAGASIKFLQKRKRAERTTWNCHSANGKPLHEASTKAPHSRQFVAAH